MKRLETLQNLRTMIPLICKIKGWGLDQQRIMMKYKLSDLLPYKSDFLLCSMQEKIRVLYLLLFMYQSTQHAIQAYCLNKYEDFDAQVSENLCQLRAYQLVELISKDHEHITVLTVAFSSLQKFVLKCQYVLTKYAELLKRRPSHYSQEIDQDIRLNKFLADNQLDVELSDELYFLSQAHILSKYKLVGKHYISHGIDYEKLCKALCIQSKTYIRKVVHKIQRNISEFSCQFIFNMASDVENSKKQHLLLKFLYDKDEVGRHVLGCYEVTKMILQNMFNNKRIIKVVVSQIFGDNENKISFILEPSIRNGCYKLSKLHEQDLKHGVMTFLGVSKCNSATPDSKEEYIQKFISIGFEKIILLNMAQHPQYSGLLLNSKKYNPYAEINSSGLLKSQITYIKKLEDRFLKDKCLAPKLGCAAEKSNLFLLTHIRCDNVAPQCRILSN